MRRRPLLTGAAAVAMGTGIALRVGAQADRVKRIGVLTTLPRDHSTAAPFWAIAVDEMKRLGWEEGRNLAFDVRASMGDPAKLQSDAEQLVAAKVDLIRPDHNGAVSAAMRATTTIPIVMIADAATEHGFAQSLARPGGNVTGVIFLAHDEISRVLSLLREVRPGLARIGMPINLENPIGRAYFRSWETVVAVAGIKLFALPIMRELPDVAPSLRAALREQVQALLLPILPLLNANGPAWDQINAWAIEHKVVTRGSLLSRGKSVVTFGANVEALVRLTQAQSTACCAAPIRRSLQSCNRRSSMWSSIRSSRVLSAGRPRPRCCCRRPRSSSDAKSNAGWRFRNIDRPFQNLAGVSASGREP